MGPEVEAELTEQLKAFLRERQQRALWADSVAKEMLPFIDWLEQEKGAVKHEIVQRLAVEFFRLLNEQMESTTTLMELMWRLFRDPSKLN